MPSKRRSRRIAGLIAVAAAAIVSPVLAFVAWDQANFNFGEVQPGRIYRSGQMTRAALAKTLREQHIQTVLNLRGSNPSDAWYHDEVAATNAEGATQVDVAMSSCLWMSRAQLRAVIRVLDEAEYPLLIHCSWGSERTGLVSAFAELLRLGATLDDARAQFSIRHLFVPVNDGKVMALHLRQYESWLRKKGLTHDPTTFRQWVHHGFQPGVPSREQWPYDPYPLTVITRPGAAPQREPVNESAGATRLRK
jgi:hypothetical protein